MDKTIEVLKDCDQEPDGSVDQDGRSCAAAASRDGGVDPHVVAYFDRPSPISAEYRALCRNLLNTDWAKPPKSILITSSVPGEGNSITTLNLGVTFADDPEARVVVLDANLRNPSLHRLLGEDNECGLADHLAGDAPLDELLMPTVVSNLFLLPAGSVLGNPTRLLSSTRFRDLIRGLSEEFDHVIIDTPPVVSFSDAAVIAPHADGVLLVVKMGETPRKVVTQAQFLLHRVDARILGTVLTHKASEQDG